VRLDTINPRTAIITAVIIGIAFWLYTNRQITEWHDEVPNRFRGSWKLVEDYIDDDYGVRLIYISSNQIGTYSVLDENETRKRNYPVRKVSATASKNSDHGSIIIFYGDADEDTITKNRMEISYGTKEMINVQEIVPTGWGDDRWFDMGDFVKIK